MQHSPFAHIKTVVIGGGDLGSGVAYRLCRSGFPVLITELQYPLLVRRAVSYGSAVREGLISVDGLIAQQADSLEKALAVQAAGRIAVIVDPEGQSLPGYDPAILIDARMLKRDPGPYALRPDLIIGLGPGFNAPVNCDVVIETNRGHNLGRVIRHGEAEANTGLPGSVQGKSSSRVLRAPADGSVVSLADIGDVVSEGQELAHIGEGSVLAPFDGVLRGLVHEGLEVQAGMKIGDVDPRARQDHCFTISEKALAIGGGVLEAIFSHSAIQQRILPQP